ncbi:glycogenin glucosyltransferase [Steccherinum ochraceum]|uniref:glycogenin glucosyltransferase n=1 Tax=Steccherinum ochraceum TaxID=92696 RepID=A0A4V2MWJ3_9APHY|nr:glycogenin glucosyltransferase [Steccherinum ochraceum]
MATPYAFVTLVSSDSYLPGALALVASLRDIHPLPPVAPEVAFQTVCLVTPETVDVSSIKLLRRSFDLVVGVEVIEQEDIKGLQLLGRLDLNSVLTKLHIFRLTQYSKLIFLDADVLPIRPLSHLFTLPHEFSAVPDVGWPDIFNSGVMVLSPGEEKFTELVELLKSKGSWDGGDQGLLNEWRGDNWHRLSFTYNTTPTAAYTYAPAYERFGSQISAIHFIGPNKPWKSLPFRAPGERSGERPQLGPQQTYDYSSLLDRWFEVYDRNYRTETPVSRSDFEVQRYSSAWADVSANERSSTPMSVASPIASVFGLEDLRRIATEGYSSMGFGGAGAGSSGAGGGGQNTVAPAAPVEGEYRTMPLEGRVDLMRPKREPPPEHQQAGAEGSHGHGNHDPSATPQQAHIDLPAGIQQMRMYTLPTPGPNEIPPAPYHHGQSLPPSETSTPYYGPPPVEYREDHTPHQGHHGHHHHYEPAPAPILPPPPQTGFYESDQYSSEPARAAHRGRHSPTAYTHPPFAAQHSYPPHLQLQSSPSYARFDDTSDAQPTSGAQAEERSNQAIHGRWSPNRDRTRSHPSGSPPHLRRDSGQYFAQSPQYHRADSRGDVSGQRPSSPQQAMRLNQSPAHHPTHDHHSPRHIHQRHSPPQQHSVHQHMLNQHTQSHQKTRSSSPPKVTWNPALEPPPNDPPAPSAFPVDTYFPNVWDQGRASAHHDSPPNPSTPQVKSPAGLFEPPPQPIIPEQLLRDGRYSNVLGHTPVQESPEMPQNTPTPDRNKVKSVFPWEEKPRHAPRRVFPSSDPVPTEKFIEEVKPSPPLPKPSHHDRVHARSPPGGFPQQMSFSNAWDAVPSIQTYASKLLRPRQQSAPLPQAPENGWRKWEKKEREKWQERQDASSMDGDDEDEGDDDGDESDGSNKGGKQRPRSSSSASAPAPAPSKGKKEYRMRGVQTISPEMFSKAVQVSILRENGTLRLRTESADPGGKRSVGVGGGPQVGLGLRRDWPSTSSTSSLMPSAVPRDFRNEPEQTAGTPSVNVTARSSMPFPSASSPTGLRSPQTLGSPRTYSPPHVQSPPKMQSPTKAPSPPRVASPKVASSPKAGSPRPGNSRRASASGLPPRITSPLQITTQSSQVSGGQQVASPRPVASRRSSTSTPPVRSDSPLLLRTQQSSTPPPRLLPKLSSPFSPQLTRSISAETNATLSPSTTQSSLATPESTPVTATRKGGRVWDPSRGVDVFKRSSEEVLTRFLRMGSFEEGENETQKHHVS